MNYLQKPRFNHQSEQASESAHVSKSTNEITKCLGGPPIILNPIKETNLTRAMYSLFESLLPTKESNEKRRILANKIEKILNDEWPDKDIKVHMFGSSMNELGTTYSDVDLCVTTHWNGLKNIFNLSNCLAKHKDMVIEQIVSKAKVPIVRLFDHKLDLACDINVNNTLALHNTRLIRNYVNIDPRVRPLAMVVKYWARRRVLNDAAKGGTISTYTWTCIILNFLQLRTPPILPVLHNLPHAGVEPIMVNGEDASFCEDVCSLSQYGSQNKETIGGLLFAFFRRMAYEFDYDNHVISLRQGKYLTKVEKGWDTCKGWKMLCVEEPFNTTRNLGNSADDISVNGLRDEFRRAYNILYETACLEKLCEEYHFPIPYINNNNYYNPPRYNKYKRNNYNKQNAIYKQGNKKHSKLLQNGQNGCLSNTTDNFHDINEKSNDDEEDGSSMRRFDSVRQNGHYNGSEESTPVSENSYYCGENNDGSIRNNIPYQNRRYNTQYNVFKENEQMRSQSRQKGNSHTVKKKNDDHNYGQSQDSEYEGVVRYVDPISNQSQSFYKSNNNQKADNNKKGSARFQYPSYSEQKPFYSQNTITYHDSDNKYNSDQKSFINHYDHDKRTHNKHSNRNGYNFKQAEEPIITDDLSSNSNFDRSNPTQISSSKQNHKLNIKNRNYNNKNVQASRQYQKHTENVDFISCNNYKVDDSLSSNSIPPSNSGNGGLPVTLRNDFIATHQFYHRQSNDGPINQQRRMSHQSSSDGSNSQTSGNTSNTSNTSYSSSNTKSSYKNNTQNNYQPQNHQNKSNGFNNNKKKKNNNNSGNLRTNNANNSPSPLALNCGDSNLQDTTFNTPSHINQGQHYNNDYNASGHNSSNNTFRGYNNNSSSSNSWKGSNGHYNSSKIINSNNNGKLASNGNNFSNRGVNNNNSNNNHSRSNFNNNNSSNYSRNPNNNNNAKQINGSNHKIFDGSNNSNVQVKNFNNSKNGGNNQSSKKYGRHKNLRGSVKTENKDEGVNCQQQCSQDAPFQERQNSYYNSQQHQTKKVGQTGQNIGKGKGSKKYPPLKQNVECQQQQ